MLLKREELWVVWSEKNGGFCSKVGIDVIYFPTLHCFCQDNPTFFFRRNYDDIITVLTYGDSSTSSDPSDEDLLDEIFVSSMFPDYKVDYPRTNIDDLNESQCVAMFRYQAM